MKQLLIISIILFVSIISTAKSNQIRVAILDTGIDSKSKVPLCLGDHKTFIGDDIWDSHGHGTIMANVITDEAKGADFCFVIVKYYAARNFNNPTNFVKGLKHISTLKVDFVNISGGGQDFDKEEKGYIETILKTGARIIAAAGNERMNLTKKSCNFFPACYFPEIIVVGGIGLISGNHGEIVDIYAPSHLRGLYGTSVSTAWVTGNLVRVLGKMK